MLTEEAHHMFVGESGIMRVVKRTCELMREHDSEDVRPHGGIDLGTIQKFINFHYSICLDLFGSERSTNAANYYSMGLKGRYQETKIDDDHVLTDAHVIVPRVEGDHIATEEMAALPTMNLKLREDFAMDSQRGLNRFNKAIREYGLDVELTLPDPAFNRNIGIFRDINATPEGRLISDDEWQTRKYDWLPSPDDYAFVRSLMVPVIEPGKMAGWISPPKRGIHGKPIDYDYVLFH
jgi:benzoyl-CoA 2,3-dioxygenase component B